MPILANAGLPMLIVTAPILLLALPFLAAFEAVLTYPIARQLNKRALMLWLRANAYSTFVGLPILWVGLVVFEQIFVGGGFQDLGSWHGRWLAALGQAAWLPPYRQHLPELIEIGTSFLLMLAYPVSTAVEYLDLRRELFPLARKAFAAALLANSISYALIFCWKAPGTIQALNSFLLAYAK